jgi:hypothetical protein
VSPSLKFDEFKYAVCRVPFTRKWRLKLQRDLDAERRLHESLETREPYAVLHLEGSDRRVEIDRSAFRDRGLEVVEIKPGIAPLLDWLTVIDRAAEVVMLDSVYANLVEQLGLAASVRRTLILRSPCLFMPVYGSGWQFTASTVRESTGPA